MKKRILASILTVCLLLALVPQAFAAKQDVVAYPVDGGNIYFDKATGTITDCDEFVRHANDIPTEIDGIPVTAIGNDAFAFCEELRSIRVPDSVTSIGDSAFFFCTKLANVFIPDSVTSIDKYAFLDCYGLIHISIPESVTYIGDGVFANCSSLTSAELPSNLTLICDSMFSGCDSLTDIVIPNRVTTIGPSAFQDCFRLTSITIPNYVTSIGAAAFRGCSGLTSITIPSRVKTIGDQAFIECFDLKSVYFKGNAPTIGEYVFYHNTMMMLPDLLLYYVEGKTGWTTPTWNGYRTATWDGLTDPNSPAAGFTDLVKGSWYYDAVNFVLERGLFNGVSTTSFQPGGNMTRGMLVTVLWRLAGEPEATGTMPFVDVEAGRYYTTPVLWAASKGIVNGMDDTHFNPNGNVTREQLATILYRYAEQYSLDMTPQANLSTFPDANSVHSYAQKALSWAYATELINGVKNATTGVVRLDPSGNATRAQVATIFMRFTENT